MAAATVAELRNMLGGLAGMSDAVVTQSLNDAALEVELSGIGESNSAFSLLQRYFAAHVLSGKGGEGAPISSESVDDVSTSYAFSETSVFGASWLDKFESLKAKTLGMEHRIL